MSGVEAIRTGRGMMATTVVLHRRLLHDQVAGELSLTATRLAEYRCVAVDC